MTDKPDETEEKLPPRPEYLAPLDDLYYKYEITDAERFYDPDEDSFMDLMFDEIEEE